MSYPGLGPSDRLSLSGEAFVELCATEMECLYTRTGGKTPLHDGFLHIIDPVSSHSHTVGVQVKTGLSHIRRKARYALIRLDRRHIRAWRVASIPTIIVWANREAGGWSALWGNSRFAKLRTASLKLSYESRLNKDALPVLLDLAKSHVGTPDIPDIVTPPAIPITVPAAKKAAWVFFRSWRYEGSVSPHLGRVSVTLRAWRHITRVSSPQRAIIHKLSLLPCARELVERAPHSLFLRAFDDPDQRLRRELRALRGFYRSKHQANLMVEVILDVVRTKKKVVRAKLYSIHERRGWYE